MSKQLVSRLLQSVVTIWAVVTVVFFLMRISGDPVAMIYAGDPRPEAQEDARALREQFGLDRPVLEQYVTYLVNVVRLDFGNSIASRRSVTTMISEELPHTLRLTVTAFLVSYFVALPVGVLVAVRRNSWIDYLTMVISMICVSIPVFWLGIMLMLLFSIQLAWLPAVGMGSGGFAYLILPVMTNAIPRVAFMTRFIRGTMLDVLNEDYLRTARAKGLNNQVVIYRHALRNALIPIITVAGLQIGYLVSGSVIIERVFGLPGLGDLLVDSISARDFPVTQAVVLIIALSIVILNLLVDMLYVYIDPRLRAE